MAYLAPFVVSCLLMKYWTLCRCDCFLGIRGIVMWCCVTIQHCSSYKMVLRPI